VSECTGADHHAYERVHTVVLTALDLEYRSVRQYLTDLEVVEHPAGSLFEVGTIHGTQARVAVAATGGGNQATAVLTERVAAYFRPQVILVVGIAGALHPDLALGDIVVATRIYGYHSGIDEPDGYYIRPRAWDAPHGLEQRARQLARRQWWEGSPLLHPHPDTFNIHFRPVAAGEVVINSRSSVAARRLRQSFNDAAAVEMESAGAAHAAHLNGSVPLLAIRGISDLADGHKRDVENCGSRLIATTNAASFAMALAAYLISSRGADNAGARTEPPRPMPRLTANGLRMGAIARHANA
jgi:nucleoside phosphorylase